MTLYAIERIDDAVSLSRELLFPVQFWLWAKLAVVVAFVGLGSGGGGFEGVFSNAPSTTSTVGQTPGFSPDFGEITLPENLFVILAVVVAVLFVFGLLFAAVGAIMEFVLVTALRDREIAIRRTVRQHARKGLGLFGFRVVLGLLASLLIGGIAVGLFWSEISMALAGEPIDIDATSAVGRGLLVGLVALVVGVPIALVHGFTTEFVVPVMLEEDTGVLAGWKRLSPVLREHLVQYGAYLLIAFALRIVTSIAAGIVVGILSVVILIPFAVVGLLLGVGTLLTGTVSTVTLVLLVVLVLVYLATVATVSGFAYVPVRAFHRYHALLVLGDTDAGLDVIADIRPPLSGQQS